MHILFRGNSMFLLVIISGAKDIISCKVFINFGMEFIFSFVENICDTFLMYVYIYLEVSYHHVNRTINNQN